jgi:hypothetical protein
MTTEDPTHRFFGEALGRPALFRVGLNLRARTVFIVSAASLMWLGAACLLLALF